MESDRVERKASAADRDRIREAICAFANNLPDHRRPGVLFVGVNDDGTCANLPITDELEEQLAATRFIDADRTPTVVGILTLGKSPRDRLACAYVQFLRVDGTELTSPVKDQKESRGRARGVGERGVELQNSHVAREQRYPLVRAHHARRFEPTEPLRQGAKTPMERLPVRRESCEASWLAPSAGPSTLPLGSTPLGSSSSTSPRASTPSAARRWRLRMTSSCRSCPISWRRGPCASPVSSWTGGGTSGARGGSGSPVSPSPCRALGREPWGTSCR